MHNLSLAPFFSSPERGVKQTVERPLSFSVQNVTIEGGIDIYSPWIVTPTRATFRLLLAGQKGVRTSRELGLIQFYVYVASANVCDQSRTQTWQERQ